VPLSPNERKLRASIAAHTSWARTADPSARAAKGAEGLLARFEAELDPTGQLAPHERRRRAEHLRAAHMKRLALRSAQTRRARAATRAAS
jgi:hypothetical protein